MVERKIDVLTIILIVIAAFTVLLQIYKPKTQTEQTKTMFYFFAILSYIGVLYFVGWFSRKVKFYLDKINQNIKDIKGIKEQMEIEKKFSDIDKRLSILEYLKEKNKKDAFGINPQWIFLIILLVFFYLYLRSLGIVP